jgi:hypothetical protein
LSDALVTARATGERFCEPEILRVRGGRLFRAGRVDEASADYRAAVLLTREQGSRLLELRALTDWVRLPGSPDGIRDELRACAAAVAVGGPSRCLDDAVALLGRR